MYSFVLLRTPTYSHVLLRTPTYSFVLLYSWAKEYVVSPLYSAQPCPQWSNQWQNLCFLHPLSLVRIVRLYHKYKRTTRVGWVMEIYSASRNPLTFDNSQSNSTDLMKSDVEMFDLGYRSSMYPDSIISNSGQKWWGLFIGKNYPEAIEGKYSRTLYSVLRMIRFHHALSFDRSEFFLMELKVEQQKTSAIDL